MLKIVYLPTGTTVSEHAYTADAQQALTVIETTPPSHEIQGEAEPAQEVGGEENG